MRHLICYLEASWVSTRGKRDPGRRRAAFGVLCKVEDWQTGKELKMRRIIEDVVVVGRTRLMHKIGHRKVKR